MKWAMLAARTLAVVGAMTLVSACGGSSSSSKHASTVASSTLTRAAYVSSTQSGFRAVMHLHETVGSNQVAMVGTGSFTPASHAGSMTMQMALPGAAGAALGGGSLNVDAVYAGGTFYLKLPSAVTSQIPGNKPWLKFSLAALAHVAGIPGLSALANESSTLNDPGQYLSYLRATTTGSVKNLGQATVDGVQTTHYHAQIDLSKLANVVPASARSSVEQLVAELQKRFGYGAMPVDVWVDGSNRIRREAIDYSLQVPGSGTSRVAMVIDFSDYGPQPAPAIPPPSQTADLLALLHGSA